MTISPGLPQSVWRGGDGYPEAFGSVYRAPVAIWWRGRLPLAEERFVAIVGSRAASGEGCRRAREMARSLAGRGLAIVSGGAFGIDAAAHEGALDAAGVTFAIFGCGVDVAYPDRHAGLFDRITARGGLLSEHVPGTPPRRAHFPQRNRLIVALAQAVVVVEAAPRSGALVTANLALAQGRRLLAVAGSPGTDALLRSGDAAPVADGDEIMEALSGRVREATLPSPPQQLLSLIEALRAPGDTASGLARRLGLPLSQVMGALTDAELGGWVGRAAGGRWVSSVDEVRRGH